MPKMGPAISHSQRLISMGALIIGNRIDHHTRTLSALASLVAIMVTVLSLRIRCCEICCYRVVLMMQTLRNPFEPSLVGRANCATAGAGCCGGAVLPANWI